MTRQSFWALKMSKKFIPSPRYEVLKFCAVSWHFAPNFTLFSTTFAELWFAAHRKVELAKGLIIGFEIFGFGPSKPELWHFSFVPENANLPHFFPLLGKILVLRVLPAYRKKIGCLPLNIIHTYETLNANQWQCIVLKVKVIFKNICSLK